MAVTRIKNNQITDATIFANTKIAPGTIVGSLFNPSVTINSNISIVGNLTVTGNTNTINSINTLVYDPLVIFNNGYTGVPAYDVGILVDRNLQATSPTNYGSLNSAWVWREADGSFEGILTTETGSTQGTVNRTAFANLIIGNTIVRAPSVTSVSKTTGALVVDGGVGIAKDLFVGKSLTVDNGTYGNVVTTEFGSLYAAGYGPNTSSILQAAAQNFAQGMGMWAITGGFGTLYSSSGINFLTGTTVRDKDIPTSGVIGVSVAANGAIIAGQQSIASTSTQTGALIVAGTSGTGLGGNLNVGQAASFETNSIFIQSNKINDVVIGKDQLKSGVSANVTALGAMQGTTSIGVNTTLVGAAAGPAATPANATYIGMSAGNLATGSDSTYLGYNSGSLITTGQFNVILGSYDGNAIATLSNQVVVSDGAGAPRIRIDNTGNVFVVSGVNSTTANTGAFTVQGGAGIGGNLNVGGALSIASARVSLNATQTSIVLAGNTATTYLNTDSVIIGQKIGSGTNFGTKATIIGSESSNTNTNATENTLVGYRAGYSGAGQQTTAIGSQAGLNLLSSATNNQLFGYNAGSQITTGDFNTVLGANTMTGLETVNNNIMISDGQGTGRIRVDDTGVVTVYATTQSDNPGTGALVVYGGLGIGGNTKIQGNLTVFGNLSVLGNTTTLGSQNLTVQDSVIELHTFANLTPLTIDDGRDVGIRAHYYKSSDDHAFFGWQNSTENFVYLQNAVETSGTHSGVYGNVQFGSLWLSNTTASTDQTTGALVVKGGVGIGGRATINNAVVDNNLTASGTNALITFSPTGTGYVTISPAQLGTIDNMTVGGTKPASGTFKDLTVDGATSPAGRNVTFTGNGFVNIKPTGTVDIAPTATGDLNNIYIGNTTPRQATFTAATVQNDLNLTSLTANSALFISPSGNLALDQRNSHFNFQRLTGNTYATTSLSLGHATQNDLLVQGTDTLNIRYQADSYLAQSDTVANTISRTMGWTTSTSRGTPTAPDVTQDGDFNGIYSAYAWTGATPAYQEIAGMRYVNQGTTAATNGIGGQAQIWTKRDDGALTLALRVDAAQTATFTGQVVVANSTISNTTTEGALYVQGGGSFGGNLNIGLGVRVNDSRTANRDFIVRGDQDNKLIWAYTNPTYNQVIVGNNLSTVETIVGAKFHINSTDAMVLPKGTTSQRPGGAQGYGSPAPGMLRFNTVTADIEYYDGSDWFSPRTSALTVVTSQQFSGNGVQTLFGLSRVATTNGTFVAINGVLQEPGLAYSVTDDVLTFSEAPAVNDEINIRTVTLTSEVRGLESPDGFVSLIAENSGMTFKGQGGLANVVAVLNDGTTSYSGVPAVTVGLSPTLVHEFSASVYRSAKFTIQVRNDLGASYEVSEVMVIHDNTTAYRTQYNRVSTLANGAALGSVTVSLADSLVKLYYTGNSTNNIVTARAELIANAQPYLIY